MRPTLIADEAEDKNVARSKMINDCQIVYVQSIGGPAAAKVVRVGLHPVKVPTRLKPAAEGQGFIYLVSGAQHCLGFNNHLEAATGLVLAAYPDVG